MHSGKTHSGRSVGDQSGSRRTHDASASASSFLASEVVASTRKPVGVVFHWRGATGEGFLRSRMGLLTVRVAGPPGSLRLNTENKTSYSVVPASMRFPAHSAPSFTHTDSQVPRGAVCVAPTSNPEHNYPAWL